MTRGKCVKGINKYNKKKLGQNFPQRKCCSPFVSMQMFNTHKDITGSQEKQDSFLKQTLNTGIT